MEKIIDRIRKLLRLARDKGASENEAAVALAMAQKLMLEHDIRNVEEEQVEVSIRGEWVHDVTDKKWERIVAMAVAKLFNCRLVTNGRGDAQFVGKRTNIEVCEETLRWVFDQIETLYKEGLRAFRSQFGQLSKETRGDFRRSFKEACSMRILHRVNEIAAVARNQIPDHMALVVIDQSLAAADELIAHLGKGKAMRPVRSGFGTGAGRAAGDRVQLQGNIKK